MQHNEQLDRATQVVADGRNVLITGRAGTGKSTLLAQIRDSSDMPTAVLAPTGVAALNVGGQTIHRFFSFPPSVTVDDIVSGAVAPQRNRHLVSQLGRLIIDEVSMVRADLLDCVDAALQRWGPAPGTPFGGVQMVLVGDPYQLPPVVTDDSAEHFASRYQTPFFFSADALAKLDYELVELFEIFRQRDPSFIAILNAIRDNSITDGLLELLNARVDANFKPPVNDVFITLTTTRRLADKVNNARLDSLDGEEFVSEATVTGDFPDRPTKVDLRFKVGAQIMMLANDPTDRWVNGSLGVVQAVPDPGWQNVSVLIVDTGELVEVEPFTWTVSQPRLEGGRLAYDEVGKFSQLPFDLAWAITIHKGQGKTFDQVVVDLGGGTFAEGQLYVALSRCRSLEGLVLRQPVERRHIRVNDEVGRFLGHSHLTPQSLADLRVASVAVNATGHGTYDRIVEIAVVITKTGRVVEEYDSIVHPMRDLTGSGEHGVSAAMASMAPSFAEAWAAIAPSLNGCVVAADGLAPLMRLMKAELERADGARADLGSGICTRELSGPDLRQTCIDLGITPVESVRALDRARAIASVLLAMAEREALCTPVGHVEAGWELPRLQRRPGSADTLVRQPPDGPASEPEAPYARLLAMLLDDGRLDDDERLVLVTTAQHLELDDAACTRVHATFCESMVTAANRDAEVTDEEWAFITAVHHDLGLTPPSRPAPPARTEVRLERGMRVCLTGLRDTATTMGEHEVEQRLRDNGLVPVGSVTAKCGLLVTAERSSMSKKASRARHLGLPIIEVDELLALLELGDIADAPQPVPVAPRPATKPTARRKVTTLGRESAPIDVAAVPKGQSIDRYSRAMLRAVVVHVDPDGSLEDLALFNAVFGFLGFTNRSARRIEAICQAIDAERGDLPGTFADRMADSAAAAIEAVQTSGDGGEVARTRAARGTDAVALTPGMRLCFTGQAIIDGKRINRNRLEAAAERAGLIATNDVSGSTNVLVCPDDYDRARSKFVKALKLGVELITVSEFVAQVGLDDE